MGECGRVPRFRRLAHEDVLPLWEAVGDNTDTERSCQSRIGHGDGVSGVVDEPRPLPTEASPSSTARPILEKGVTNREMAVRIQRLILEIEEPGAYDIFVGVCEVHNCHAIMAGQSEEEIQHESETHVSTHAGVPMRTTRKELIRPKIDG